MDSPLAKRPWHIWAVGGLSALWNCGGVMDYTMTKTRNPSYMAAFTPEQIAWFDSFPLWMNIAWALGVWGALTGSILLLFRSRWAVHAFAISLAGLVIGTVYQFGISDMPASLKTPGGWAFTAALWLVAIFLLWYARQMQRMGQLR
jgi:hypothetical protein